MNTPQGIVLKFNTTVNTLTDRLERKAKTAMERADIDRLRQRMNLLRKMHVAGGQAILEASGPYLYRYSDQITGRDESFFMQMDVRAELGAAISREDEFAYSLIDNIKRTYAAAKQVEKDDVYRSVLSLHTDYIQYCILTGCSPERPAAPQ